ncbi:hypothetical protein FACS1894219_09570 [Clostridia bacterium]|nr:hypothetical protein FACS1894219_09570 [Clostridia bacterium]
MKTINKKNFSSVLILAIAASTLLNSCNAASDTNGTTAGNNSSNAAGTEQQTTERPDSLPDNLNFNGETLNLLVRYDDLPLDDASFEFYAEAEDSDIVNDAVYKRNKTVEDRLNIKLNVIKGPGWQDYSKAMSMIKTSISSGDNSYDLIAGWSANIPSLSLDGILLDLKALPHLNLSEKWWNQSLVEELDIAGKLNFVAGDVNLTFLSSCMVIFVNNTLQQEYGLPNIYDTVFNGDWTLDYMTELTRNVHKDLNGDGVMDDNDQYGAIWAKWNGFDGYMQAAGIKMTKKDENGIPYLDVEYEKLAALVDKVYKFSYENEGVTVPENTDMVVPFKANRALLVPGWIRYAETSYRDMESDYSIIPYPKFDDKQDQYYARVQDGASLMCIPVNSNKLEMTGAFLEAAASESYRNVSSVYFDVAMKTKYTRDDTSAKMLDIIREGAYLNFASIYNYSIGSPWAVMRDLLNEKKNNFASWYEQNEPKIKTAIEKLVAKMESAE